MKNYKMILQYDGTRFKGWQKLQHDEDTIQEKLETLLERIAQEEDRPQEIQVNGAGRTDAGVHALGQCASFHMETRKTPAELLRAMNQFLPESIAVISMETVPERFHARLNATGKTYRYRIINSKIPHVFERRYTCMIAQELDLEAMRRAAACLVGCHDFRAFCSKKGSKKSTERTISSVSVEAQGEEVDLLFTGNGFLYHMVRIMSGTLIEVGLHKRDPGSICEILQSKDREQAGYLAPAEGLFLEKVFYE